MTYSARLTILALSLSLCSAGAWAKAHPTGITDSANCLECHAAKATGTHVHAAVKQGCASCHTIENHDGETHVRLKLESPALCLGCHQNPVFTTDPHFSYSPGRCLGCHDPHGSGGPSLIRAGVNELCLNCHLRTKESTSSTYLPTIALTSNNSLGHPFAKHPVKGKTDPLTGNEMSCVSCHLAHGGDRRFHLKEGAQIPEDALNQNVETKDMCNKCHQAMWGLDGSATEKRSKTKK